MRIMLALSPSGPREISGLLYSTHATPSPHTPHRPRHRRGYRAHRKYRTHAQRTEHTHGPTDRTTERHTEPQHNDKRESKQATLLQSTCNFELFKKNPKSFSLNSPLEICDLKYDTCSLKSIGETCDKSCSTTWTRTRRFHKGENRRRQNPPELPILFQGLLHHQRLLKVVLHIDHIRYRRPKHGQTIPLEFAHREFGGGKNHQSHPRSRRVGPFSRRCFFFCNKPCRVVFCLAKLCKSVMHKQHRILSFPPLSEVMN